MAVWDDPQELKVAIRKARGPMTQRAVAERLGISEQTVKRWEAGNVAALGASPEARWATAVLVGEVTGNREALGLEPVLSVAAIQEQVDELRTQVRSLLGTVSDDPAAALEQDEQAELERRRSDPSGSQTEEPEPEAGSS